MTRIKDHVMFELICLRYASIHCMLRNIKTTCYQIASRVWSSWEFSLTGRAGEPDITSYAATRSAYEVIKSTWDVMAISSHKQSCKTPTPHCDVTVSLLGDDVTKGSTQQSHEILLCYVYFVTELSLIRNQKLSKSSDFVRLWTGKLLCFSICMNSIWCYFNLRITGT